MIILEPSNTPDEHSPLKNEVEIDTSAALVAASPPYAPTLPPNPIPSYQAVPHSHHITPHRRRSFTRWSIVVFVIVCLVLLLYGVFMDSSHKDTFHRASDYPLNRACEDCLCLRCQPPKGIDDPGRVFPIQYPPQTTILEFVPAPSASITVS